MYNPSNASNGAVDTFSSELPYSSSDVSPNSPFCRPSDIFGYSWANDQAKDDLTYAEAMPEFSAYLKFMESSASDIFGHPWAHDQAKGNLTYAEAMPEFPAHPNLMESSASETGLKISSAPSEHLQKPAFSNADSGTYTCTYNSCTLRFETPQRLQKHKREGHRNTNAANMPKSSSMTSAALLKPDSQIGPHRCERINPTTGKRCNIKFSRPYDFTRHEDTIHNTRKRKLKCARCVRDKVFSRKDALTRHIRVMHLQKSI